jgi:UDP-3-O-acyl N-acetylglucosamine deacetylase
LETTSRLQTTIANEVSVSGIGYWSGLDVTVKFRPAESGTGVVFARTDVDGCPKIPALIHNRVQSPRRTTLMSGGHKVEMVEHILSALVGLQIDNCIVEANQIEMPGMDGSSIAFTTALQSSGRVEQDQPRKQIVLDTPIRIEEKGAWVEAVPTANESFELVYDVDYSDCPSIGKQHTRYKLDRSTYQQQIAPARTFVLKHEAELLQKQGLGKRVSYRDLLVFDEQGPIDNTLKFDDECGRHKILDMIGDLALTGYDIVGRVHGHKSGHRLNSQLAFSILHQAFDCDSLDNINRYSA